MVMAVISPLALGLAGCADSTAPVPFAPEYRGIETRLLDGDLVNFHVSMRGARDPGDVERYAECAAAQYALIRGYGFARHLRTSVSEEAGIWQGDAVYTISAALPRGLLTIDAEVVAANCAENGIPMV
ncbi:lipoprotein [Roseovarius mucosus]|nr:lipoprotein [Roseovarius mucosus]